MCAATVDVMRRGLVFKDRPNQSKVEVRSSLRAGADHHVQSASGDWPISSTNSLRAVRRELCFTPRVAPDCWCYVDRIQARSADPGLVSDCRLGTFYRPCG